MFQLALIKIFVLTILSFLVALSWLPKLSYFLTKYKLGKNIGREENAPIFSALHQKKSGTPTMGGFLIWVTVFFLAIFFYALHYYFTHELFAILNFLTRPQTFLPLGALVASGIIGLIDDFLNVRGIGSKAGGFKMIYRLLLYTFIAIVGAYWFYYKLEWDTLHIPFFGDKQIGLWYIPVFVFIIVATAFSVNESDGLDGLAGGLLLIGFMSYGAIALMLGKIELAALSGVISGALVAFLWFNIYPAKFFMGDTGAMALGVTLAIIALLTNTALLLPFFAFIPMIESLTVIAQMISKKVRHKKIFLSTPVHHHFEAIGWAEPQIVMRFWLLNGIAAIMGLIIFILDRNL